MEGFMGSDVVKVSKQLESDILARNLAGVSTYTESTMVNYTGVPIYVLKPTGEIIMLPTTVLWGTEKVVEFKSIERSVLDVDANGRPRMMNDNFKREALVVSVGLRDLQKQPVYIPQFGVAVGIHNDNTLKSAHPLLKYGDQSTNMKAILAERTRGATSFVCSINTYDCRVTKACCIINNVIMTCEVTHKPDIPEKIVFSRSTGDEYKELYTIVAGNGTKRLQLEDLELCDIESPEIGKWVISTSRERLAKYLADKKQKEQEALSATEIQLRIQEGTKDLQEKNDNLNKELENLRKKVSVLEGELNLRNNVAQQTSIERTCEMKTRQVELEAEITKQRIESEKSMLDVKMKESQRKREDAERESEHDKLLFEQKLRMERMNQELDIVKAQSEAEIARAKVETAAINERVAANGETASMVKAAAVVVPAAITLGVAAYSLKSAAASSIVAPAAIASGPALLAGAAIAACSALVGKTVFDRAPKAVKKTVEKVVDVGSTVVTKTTEVVGKSITVATNTARTLVSGILGSVATIWNKTTKVLSGTGSVVKSTLSKATSMLTGAASKVYSCASKIVSGTKSFISNACNKVSSWFNW